MVNLLMHGQGRRLTKKELSLLLIICLPIINVDEIQRAGFSVRGHEIKGIHECNPYCKVVFQYPKTSEMVNNLIERVDQEKQAEKETGTA
jgi:hypothetical protein